MDPSEFVVGTDELGPYARVCVDLDVYTLIVVFKTSYWFTDRCYLYLSRRGQMVEVEFRPKLLSLQIHLQELCGEFFNSLLDQFVREQVLKETSNVRDALIKKAFSDAATLTGHVLTSDETHVPGAEQGFRDDPLNISGRKGG